MNIFILDADVKKCAQYYCDKHVIKILLEGTQILCTVNSKLGIETPYKATHINHPCVLWAERSIKNWLWLRSLIICLNKEYKYRYKKITNHKSYLIAIKLLKPNIPDIEFSGFCQVVPSKFYNVCDPISAYRNYYICEKKLICKWTRRVKPEWFLV